MGASYRPRGRLRQTRIVQAPHLVILVSHPLGEKGRLNSCPVFGTPEKALLPPLESMRAQRSVSNQASMEASGHAPPTRSPAKVHQTLFIYLRRATKGATS